MLTPNRPFPLTLRRAVAVLLLAVLAGCADRHDPAAPSTAGDVILAPSAAALEADPRAFDYFVAGATSHEWANSYLLALLSHYVYVPLVGATGDADFINAFAAHFTPLGLGGFRILQEPESDTEVVFAENENALFVVFRGTEADLDAMDVELRDVVVDVMLVMTDGVHEGFRGSASRLLPYVVEAIEGSPGKTVWLTGHSLGGALATVTAHLLRDQHGIDVDGIYTYGSPRVFNNANADAFDAAFGSRSQRWVNNRDPVPHLPFPVLLVDYTHVPVLNNIIGDAGTCTIRRNDVEQEFLSLQDWADIATMIAEQGIFDAAGPVVELILSRASLDDHDTGRYASRIFAHLPAELRAVLPEPPYPDKVATDCDEPQDLTPPTITPQVTGTVGNAGWYVSDVAISWSVVDLDSDVSSALGCDDVSVTSDTDGTTFTCVASSDGGTASETVTIRRDATAPHDVAPTPDRAADHGGWYNAPFAVTWSGTDDVSGVDSCTTANYAGPDDGSGSLSGSCTDVAGNTSTDVTFGFRYDATAPVITVTTPATGTPDYFRNQQVAAAFACTDALSGVATCTGSTAPGEFLPTSEFGTHALDVAAADAAGNTATASRPYTISYGFDGFHTPVLNLPAINSARAGQRIPFKWTLLDAAGAAIADRADLFTVAWSAPVQCEAGGAWGTLADAAATSSTGVQWDSDTQQYVFVATTSRNDSGTCRYLVVGIGDAASARALVQFR